MQNNSLIWSQFIFDDWQTRHHQNNPLTVGVVEGEGIGADLVQAALKVLSAVESISKHSFQIKNLGTVGLDRNNRFKEPLDSELIQFFADIFAEGGAILTGPGGGRFVYNLRQQFDLFCKINPVYPGHDLIKSSRLKSEYVNGVDILIVRENVSGLYFGKTNLSQDQKEDYRLEYCFSYSRQEVYRILEVAAKIAAIRRGHLTVVTKEGGVPEISQLWRDCAMEISDRLGIECTIINVDYAAYYLIQHAQELDVVVAPNLFGDILVDVSALLLGARGLSYSGNFSSAGGSVYQTNHGAAFDLVGQDLANPVAQILSMAMMLRESFGLVTEANLIEKAVRQVWHQGYRTADIQEKSCQIIGTQEMAKRIAENVIDLAQ
ncbi:MAG: isocitrate/isopropylmalate family dehydrogenase [Oscillatoria sp. PMC 1051.18]|nr:isocitrate/isopropylmalate family dehydrogenase [Oscillatoria sp. PMC 1050.18]MEC5032238.1 isocitrate/isopropylmalate family dehydrogenase [Oscillatoria sp. PMC 1051.18]